MQAQFVYVANSGDNTISGHTMNPVNGVLMAIAGSPFAALTAISGSPFDTQGIAELILFTSRSLLTEIVLM